uniref:cytochrome c oxidase subunit 2 n=1 Tax=Neorhodella cyanea TaxID=131155 RepID=UPI001FCD0ACE|nr:cytochrome c oxidase subunit 2 [Neorhodella cyanea]UNJ18813.1 cytochrome c oxidase subunit 2 [Neorhodella cyanea]
MINFLNICYLDAPKKWQLNFQNPATPVMEGIINLHHDLVFFLIIILIFVFWILFRTIKHFIKNRNKNKIYPILQGTFIELIWTITPSLILIFIAIPSFALLYSFDEIVNPCISIKIVGLQWFWKYEYFDYFNVYSNKIINFDSYLLSEEDLQKGNFRMLEVDNRLIIPINTFIRLIVTGSDVIHSWSVPSFGIKIDALPGRLNQNSLFVKREGLFYGMCSEICGINHAAMPIVVEATILKDFITWVLKKIV